MKDFSGKLAVVTGGGSGMGRELARLLAAEGCNIAMCDVSVENMTETTALCADHKRAGVRVTAHECDVSVEGDVLAFRDAVAREHGTDHINLLFNNAGIGGAGSFLLDDRGDWDRTFNICWGGVYHCTRAFMPLLVRSAEGHIVNTSSVNGFWACLGPSTAQTAYCAAKFAVKGFSEALVVDLRLNAPHVKVSVAMPGHVGTYLVTNSGRLMGKADPLEMSAADVATTRRRMSQQGQAAEEMTDAEIREAAHQRAVDFIADAPLSAKEAAEIILEGVRAERWRILVGDDAVLLDRMVRADPEGAYEESFIDPIKEAGELQMLLQYKPRVS